MPAVDKIYGTKEQWKEFHAWCKKYLPEALAHFRPLNMFGKNETGVICSLPNELDWEVLQHGNCAPDFVISRIIDQYDIYVPELAAANAKLEKYRGIYEKYKGWEYTSLETDEGWDTEAVMWHVNMAHKTLIDELAKLEDAE